MLGFQAKNPCSAYSTLGDKQMLLNFHRSKRSGHRSMAIEYTLIALLTASAAFQVLFTAGVKAI